MVFYGDRTTASIGRNCIEPFLPSVHVGKHVNKRGYLKAVQEAVIESYSARRTERIAPTTTQNVRPTLRLCSADNHSSNNHSNRDNFVPSGPITRTRSAKANIDSNNRERIRQRVEENSSENHTIRNAGNQNETIRIILLLFRVHCSD